MTLMFAPHNTPKLSICIPTFNRGAVIGQTLASIISQISGDCEVVVLDGGSTDETSQVVSEYQAKCSSIRYVRESKNGGFDRDCDRAVRVARGEYCWLTSDDDLLKPGAVARVTAALEAKPSLVVLNVEFRDFTLSHVVQERWLTNDKDRDYGPDDMDQLYADLGFRLLYVGGIVINRELWMSRDSQSYFGSFFVYVGVIFQKSLPSAARVIAEPLVQFRLANSHVWSKHVINIVWFRWPALIWSLRIGEVARRAVSSREPWRNLHELMIYRGWGCYSSAEYLAYIRPEVRSIWLRVVPKLIALAPGVIINALLIGYYSITGRTVHGWRHASLVLHDLRQSPFYFRNRGSKRRTTAKVTSSSPAVRPQH